MVAGSEFRLTSAPGAREIPAMELRSLHYFVRIAELGSITRASAHLQIAQPALTRHVQRLEDELDAPLFTRANRGVRLTEAGHKLLESAQRILRDVERAGDEIRAHKAHPSGKIVLGVTPTLCPVVVPELFGRMRRHYPMIELKVVHAGTVRLEEFVIDGRIDIGLLAEIPRSRVPAPATSSRSTNCAAPHSFSGTGCARRLKHCSRLTTSSFRSTPSSTITRRSG